MTGTPRNRPQPPRTSRSPQAARFLLLLPFVPTTARAGGSDPLPGPLRALHAMVALRPVGERIERISAHFRGTPYLLGPLGEGPAGRYDQDPLHRFDAFDCTTFVETVTALSIARSPADFPSLMDRIRYRDGIVSYVTRNHFTSRDWVPHNVAAGFFRDITRPVAGEHPVREAVAVMDLRSWYRRKTAGEIEVAGLDGAGRAARLEELRREGRAFRAGRVSLPYLALETLLGPGGDEIITRIPSGSIVDIVRPDWDLTRQAGIRLNVSHQGFFVRHDGRDWFRHASSAGSRVVTDVHFREYLEKMTRVPTVGGIHLLEVLPR